MKLSPVSYRKLRITQILVEIWSTWEARYFFKRKGLWRLSSC